MKDPRPGDAVSPANSNSNGNQQINYIGERYGWVVALVFGVLSLLAALWLLSDVRSMRSDLENIRGLIESSASSASESAAAAAVANSRADIAERRANISELYAKQVFVELNRLGYPVKTPAEEHSVQEPKP